MNPLYIYIHQILTIMPSLRVELKGNKALQALQELEQKQLITILHEPDLNSYSLPGDSISDDDFRKWIEYAESSPAVDLKEAQKRWTDQKKKLHKLLP
jgi:hypothetical protein